MTVVIYFKVAFRVKSTSTSTEAGQVADPLIELTSDGQCRISSKIELDLQPKGPPSYKLIDLHKHFFGTAPILSHGAEHDCISLMRVIAAVGPEIVDWFNNNNHKFSHFSPMWNYNKK